MRVSQLNRRLSDLRDLPLQNLPRETVGLFSRVFLEDDEGEVYEYRLVLPEMVEKDSGSISIGAPRAKALLGKAPGDRVRLPSEGGAIEADILRFINPWGEEID